MDKDEDEMRQPTNQPTLDVTRRQQRHGLMQINPSIHAGAHAQASRSIQLPRLTFSTKFFFLFGKLFYIQFVFFLHASQAKPASKQANEWVTN